MAKSLLDEFAQYAILRAAGAAALTGAVVNQLVTGITNLQKVAWEVVRIEYSLPYAWHLPTIFGNPDHNIVMGVTNSSSALQNAGSDNPAMIDWIALGGIEPQAAAVMERLTLPLVHEFKDPILCLPQSLFALLVWNTAANITTAQIIIKLWYKERELGPEDWYDLLQLRLPLGAS